MMGSPQMARRLFTVEDTFVFERGLILVPGIVEEGNERFRVGDMIELRFMDGARTQVPISSLELCTPNPNHLLPVMLPATFQKSDVPIGTEVWSTD
jgi:hypothetical protein